MKKALVLLLIANVCFAASRSYSSGRSYSGRSYSRSYTRNVNVTKVYHGGGYGGYHGYGYHPMDSMLHTMGTIAMIDAISQPRQQQVQVVHDNAQPQVQYVNQAPCVNCTVKYDANGNAQRVN